VSDDGVTITAYEDGPLLVRGPVTFLTQDGEEVDPGRATVALCRCGKSASKPFCDGTHKVAKFRATSTPDPRRTTP
jgi:CDGSH-type Zn-finger protein